MAVDTGTKKLKEYYCLTGGSVEMQYALAAMFDPSQKLGWHLCIARVGSLMEQEVSEGVCRLLEC